MPGAGRWGGVPGKPTARGSHHLPAALLGWQASLLCLTPGGFRGPGVILPQGGLCITEDARNQQLEWQPRVRYLESKQDKAPGSWGFRATVRVQAFRLPRAVTGNEKLQSTVRPHHRLPLHEKLPTSSVRLVVCPEATRRPWADTHTMGKVLKSLVSYYENG